MSEPRNPAHVLGVGASINSVNGPVFAAYFAASRERFDAQPNYRSGFFVLVDGAVYAVKAEQIDTRIRRGFGEREFAAAAWRPAAAQGSCIPGRGTASRSSRAGSGVRSGDFLREMSAMVREYG